MRDPECSKVLQMRVAFEQAQHHFLSVLRRKSGGTEIDAPIAELDHESAVLWRTSLGNVHVGKNLHARGDGILEGARNLLKFSQDTVYAHTNRCLAVLRLDVDIACAL